MSYHSDQAIDTRTCGQADEDSALDTRDGLADGRDAWLAQRAGRATEDARLLALRLAANTRSIRVAFDDDAAMDAVQAARARPLPMDGQDFHHEGES